MTTYTNINKVKVSKAEFNKMQELASINFDEADKETIDRLDATTDDCIKWLYFDFSNGRTITIDICSGTSNYYVNAVLWNARGEEETCFDDESGIEQEMEFISYNNNGTETHYLCNIEIE